MDYFFFSGLASSTAILGISFLLNFGLAACSNLAKRFCFSLVIGTSEQIEIILLRVILVSYA